MTRRGFLAGFAAALAGRLLPTKEIEQAAIGWSWDKSGFADPMQGVLTVADIAPVFLMRLREALGRPGEYLVHDRPGISPLNPLSLVGSTWTHIRTSDVLHYGMDIALTEDNLCGVSLEWFDKRYIQAAAYGMADGIKRKLGNQLAFIEGPLVSPEVCMSARSTNQDEAMSVRCIRDVDNRGQGSAEPIYRTRFDVFVAGI